MAAMESASAVVMPAAAVEAGPTTAPLRTSARPPTLKTPNPGSASTSPSGSRTALPNRA